MASCLSCEAALPSVDFVVGETLVCDVCGAEHEVLAEAPLELALIEDDDDLASPAKGLDDEADSGDGSDEDDGTY